MGLRQLHTDLPANEQYVSSSPAISIEKFDSSKHDRSQFDIPFAFYSHELYLDLFGYIINNNDENILVMQSIYCPYSFPAYYMPKRKSNWQNMRVVFATEEDIAAIEKEKIEFTYKEFWGKEYYYETKTLINPKKKIRAHINRFKSHYKYKILHEYPIDKITAFYNRWKEQKDQSGPYFKQGEQEFFYTLNNLDKYNVKQVYVEIGGELVGFIWGCYYDANHWIALQGKTDYEYSELSRFLDHELAKLFSECEYCTQGDDANEKGLAFYKHSLGPYKELPYYYIETGEREE
jgi:hypothetical protein